MFLKLPGYIGLSLASFCVFTMIFHAVAQAQTVVILPETRTPKTHPSPTMYLQPTIHNQTRTLNEQPVPSPTLYIAPPTQETQPTDTPTPTKVVVKESKATPTPLPTIQPTQTPIPQATMQPTASSAPTDLDTLFTKYSSEYGVEEALLKKIAKCESGFNPNANNSGMYLGLFQFGSLTWSSNRARMGLDTNPDLRTNAEESIRTAAYVISRSGVGAWPNCH